MSIFTPWAGSPECTAAKKIVDDVVGRVNTVKADTARITPKIGTYKKATLEKLITEAKAGEAAALKKNTENHTSGPDQTYCNAVEQKEKTLIAQITKEADARISMVKAEAKQCIEANRTFYCNYGKGDGWSGGTTGVYARLSSAYKQKIEMLSKELQVATGEKTPNPNRTV